MDFSLNEMQVMLEDSIAKFLDNDYDFGTRQDYAATDPGYSTEVWQTFADLGWTAVPFSEEDGGIGGVPIEVMVIMQLFGRSLVVPGGVRFALDAALAAELRERLGTARAT